MSAIATIVAFDGAATPVTHSLLAESVSRDKNTVVASYKEALPGVPDYAQISVVMRKQRLGSGVFRTSIRVSVPVMESVSGVNAAGYTAAPKVAYTDTFELVGLHHERSTETGRKLAQQLAINIAGGVSTTVTPVTTGPAAELYQKLICPT